MSSVSSPMSDSAGQRRRHSWSSGHDPGLQSFAVSAYRRPEEKPANPSDLETDALLDLRLRIERLRKRVALPFASAAFLASVLGVTAHVLGYWSIAGVGADGRYYVSIVTILFATILCSGPIALVGTVGYVTARARARSSWSASHASRGVPAAWLAENASRLS